MTNDFESNPDQQEPVSSTDPTVDGSFDATRGLSDDGAHSSEQPGTVIGRYKLIEAIGEGGFGTVFKAEQLEPVSRHVALKIIKLGMDTKQVIGRFEAERQALALMDHDGIARVYDAGTTDAGRPYFVMELVKGIPITTYCDRNKLSTKDRLELFKQVCAAVQHAHQKGVIHRDIKPSNVLVSDTNGQPSPKVIDFGIAKATSQRLTEKTVFTQQAQIIGTPAYMSPEQAEVTELDIDTRSDVYSLGVLLYELLAGATPFDSKKLLSAGFSEIQRIIREEDPPWPSTRASELGDLLEDTAEHRRLRGSQLVKNLKGELDWIVMKCLEKDRTRRYETANGLARDVDRYLGNEPVTASPPSRTYRLKKLIIRNRAVFAAGMAMVLLLASGVVGTSVGLVRAKRAESEAVSAASKSEQVAKFLTDMLAGVGPSAARGRDTEMLEEILQETHEKIGEELAGQPEVEGEIRSYLGTTYFDLGQFEKAREQFQLALDLLREAYDGPELGIAQQYSNLGLTDEHLADFESSEKNHLAGLAMRKELFGDYDHEVANNQMMLANLYVNQSRYEEAEPLFLDALDVMNEISGEDDPTVAICLNSLGNLMQHLKRYDEAGPYYIKALASHKASLGEDHPYVITDMVNLGWLYFNTSRYDSASIQFAEAMVLGRRVYGESNSRLIGVLSAQAQCAVELDRLDEAEALHRESLDISIAEFGPEHLNTVDVMRHLSKCLNSADKYDEADELNRKALEIQTRELGELHQSTLRSLNDIAYDVYRRGDFEEAARQYRQVADTYTTAKGRDHKDTALAINSLGRCLRGMGDLAESAECFEEAGAIRSRLLGPEHLLVHISRQDLAGTRSAQERFDEARELYESALVGYVATVDSTHRIVGTTMMELARVELNQGNPQRALELVEHSRRIVAAALGEDNKALISNDVAAVTALDAIGSHDEARKRYAEVAERLAVLTPPFRRAMLNVHAGRHLTRNKRFEEAEQMLLGCYEVFAGQYGDGHYMARRTVTAVVELYDAMAAAGSPTAADKASRWRVKLAAN